MGVHNLWELLSPVGRRVSVETLAGKKVAIDASIWIIQFMKAMRDEKGEMIRNAHLIGFFRRICKLLFLRTKPVFVFDGATPALKRRTVIARRRQRENAQMKIRKTAEKLLLNQLKTMKLNQLAEDLKNQREGSDIKGKKVLSDQTEVVKNNLEQNDMTTKSYNQEKIDEMLASSLAAEEDQSFTRNASTSTAGIPLEKEDDDNDDDDDEEMILPAMPGKVDPTVLAALPPSMQLDLLVQMRERLMAENRQKYQKVKKAPAKFSELQIESYLKTVAFRREIGEVQKSAAGRGVGGVQTSRIASESNREFIFSSTFTGDKQALTVAGAESSENQQHQTCSDSLGSVAFSVKTSTATSSVRDEPGGGIENDVETYLDDRGNLRVSRVRAMGIRMTRDLQRNLDMIKEIELESHNANIATRDVSIRDGSGAPVSFISKDQFPGTSVGANDDKDSNINSRDQQSIPKYEDSIEISFEDNGEKKCSEDDDDIFARLVAGNPVTIPSIGNTSFRKQSSGSASESDWEDGFVEDKVSSLTNDVKAEINPYFVEGNSSDESKVEKEERICDVTKSDSPSSAEYTEAVSRGCQEEETDMQEAIRRSIEDLKKKNYLDASSENNNRKYQAEIAHKNPDTFRKTNELLCETLRGTDKREGVVETSIPTIIRDSGIQLASSTTTNNENMKSPVGKSCGTYSATHIVNLDEETQEMSLVTEKLTGAFDEGGETSTTDNKFQVNFDKGDEPSTVDNSAHVNGSFLSDLVINLFDANKGGSESGHKIAEFAVPFGESSANQAPINVDVTQKLADVSENDNFLMETECSRVDVTESTLEDEILVLGQEFSNLEDEQRKNERNAESVSSEMFAECQELLQMFGLPYIIAPMEAEAQCAYMELANLVDGVVTDDSDVFLFGARSVYKNIFDDRKYVETYFMKDIENELGLSRDKLIRMALLLGSDYTEGISGIGIVNAIEVVNAFPEEDGLHKFRQWIESPDPNILGRFQVQKGSTSRKRGSVANEDNASRPDQNLEEVSTSELNQVHNDDQSVELINEQRQIFMDKHRKVSKNWHIPSSFPSEAVISAYFSPQVDKSTEPFAWGKPDLFVLRKLCWGKFGWNSQKADELLLPVLKEYNKHETQLRLEAFYTFNEKFAKVRSKRIKKAVKGIIGNQSPKVQDGSVQPVSKTRKRKTVSHIESWVKESEKRLCDADNDVARKERNSESSHKQSGEGAVSANLTPSIEGKMQSSKRAAARERVRDESSGNSRNRGRGRKQQVGMGGRKRGRVLYHAKSSSSDGNSSNNEHEVHDEKLQDPCKLRRSTRSRNPVYYSVNDLECDDAEDMGDECANKQAIDQELSPRKSLSEDAPIGPTDKNRSIFTDPSSDTGIGEIQCVMGSEVCMDEDEMCEPSVRHTDDNTECSYDYLTMGGGFCMDEDETEHSPEEQANNPASGTTVEVTADKTVHENLAESGCSHEETLNGLQVGRQTVLIKNFLNDNSNVSVPLEENTKDHTSRNSVRALSAMPLLRRKRRKS